MRTTTARPGVEKKRWRRTAPIAVAVALLASACTGEQAETTSSPVGGELGSESAGTQATQTTLAGELQSESGGEVAQLPTGSNDQLLHIDTHLNGMQAQLIGVDFTESGTVLTIRWVNGREFDSTLFGLDESILVDASGTEHLVRPVELELAESELVETELAFDRISAESGPFTLIINPEGRDDVSVDEIAPSFEIGPFSLADTAPALPAGFGLNDSFTHEAGATVQVLGVGFSDTAIAVETVYRNNSTTNSRWADGRYSGYIEDDLGNRYYLELGPGEYRAEVPEGGEVTGALVFPGRIDPAATSITMVLNEDGAETGRDTAPRFTMGPYSLDGGFESVGVLQPISASDEYTHPNTSTFELNGIRFTEAGAFVDMVVENNRGVTIRLELGRRTYVRDDLGNTYPLLAPEDNSNLEIAGDTGFAGELSFPGTIDPAATSIEVIFNDGQDAERDPERSGFPEAAFGPYTLTRGAAVLGNPPTGFGQASSMAAGELESTEGEVLGLIFDEFDGVEVDGGVLLTLPEGILFDSGQSDLGPRSDDAIDKIVQILEFYEGDDVIIIGHTDDQGSDEFNQQLSVDRASSVVDALVGAGADQSLITAEGRGESDPVDDNSTDEGRQANRRVEVMVQTTKGLPN